MVLPAFAPALSFALDFSASPLAAAFSARRAAQTFSFSATREARISPRRDETEVDPRRMGGVVGFLVQTLGKRFVKNAETRALTGLDVKPPTTIATYA